MVSVMRPKYDTQKRMYVKVVMYGILISKMLFISFYLLNCFIYTSI